jgi:hypothetical protein
MIFQKLEFMDLRTERIFENKEEDDDSKLGVNDPWIQERLGDATEEEDEKDEDSYFALYRR